MRAKRDLGAALTGAALLWAGSQLAWRWAGLGFARRGRSATPTAALMLVGGPDSTVTPPVLDALHAAGVRATFFLNADAVAQFPDLTRRIVEAGHALGADLGGSAVSLPWALAAKLKQTQQIIRTVAGEEIQFFMAGPHVPPLSVLQAARASGLTPVQGEPVSTGLPAHLPQGRLLSLSGTDSSTLAALPPLLAELKARGYVPHPLPSLPGLRPEHSGDLIPDLMGVVDVLYDRTGRIRRIGGHAHSLFRLGTAPYPLPTITLTDPTQPQGLEVAAGQRIAEFHLDSARLVQLAERPVAGRHVVKHSIHDLAAALRDDPTWNTLPAVFSISIFSDVLRLYGFTVVDLPAPMLRRLNWWSRTLRRAYGVSDLSRPHTPKLAVISRTELIRRFGERK
ncbi:polysaccharide deacetylase family protein [Deinococcus sp. QL22]|uniref:YkoP family protein n=1 Tax=Deinococcus sp. QL22 TaxID=2939437 RepID=UPI0020176982|nr:polysaccharide deacetylase family protein [Deinococcus sp. QL22]UQN05313.1 polysaccharide deacetylase family protein [Deinococcus sp. QL22]